MNIVLVLILLLQIVFFYKYFRVTFLSPLFYLLIIGFVLPFVVVPLSLNFVASDVDIMANYSGYFPQSMIWVNIIFFMWAVGYSLTGKKKRFQWQVLSKFNPSQYRFGLILYAAGLLSYILLWKYIELGFLSAFSDPLATRFVIINKAGAYHFRNLCIWSLWGGFYAIYFSGGSEFKKDKRFLLSFIFLSIIFLSLPLGQRYQVIFPFVILIHALYYDKIITKKILFLVFPLLVVVLPLLGFYREMGRTGSVKFQDFVDFAGTMDFSLFGQLIVSRFNSFEFFILFMANKDNLSMPLLTSLNDLILKFLPASMTGGSKPLDVDGLLTDKLLGGFDFGTYAFTAFPEWYLNWGHLGFFLMPLLSGMFIGKIVGFIEQTPGRLFLIVLFSDFFLFRWQFISINSFSNIDAIYFLVYAAFATFLYRMLKALSTAKPEARGYAEAPGQPLIGQRP